MHIPNISDIKAAYTNIKPLIHNTPVLSSELINNELQCRVFFKCENFQKAGAFKYRGASNAVFNLSDAEKTYGVATHSSGNHAGALAKAAAIQNIAAFIVMPNNAPQVKVDAVKSYGGKITFCEPILEERERNLDAIVEKTGATFVHPYNNFNVISGQGTCCLELVNQINEPDFVIAPVGGGGLLSGTALVAKSLWRKTQVIGAEPLNANDAWESFTRKEFVPSKNPNTIADGLLTSLGDKTFEIILKNVDQILTVTEEAIVEAMLLVWSRLKIIIEPSSAVVIAVIMQNKTIFRNKNVAVIFSGGNVDFKNLPF